MKRAVRIKQQSFYDCGAASLCSVAAWHGRIITLAKSRYLCGCTKEGITIKGIIEGAKKLDMEGRAYRAVQKDPQALDEIPLPAIAHIKRENGFYHFIAVYAAEKGYITVMDPASGRVEKWTQERFSKEWSGYIIVFEPGMGFRKINEKGDTLLKLSRLAYSNRKEMLHAIAGTVAVSLIGISTSIFIQQIIDIALPEKDLEMLISISLAIATLAGLALFINYAKGRYLAIHGAKIDNTLIIKYLNKISSLPLEHLNRYQPGEISSRTSDAFNIRLLISGGVVSIFVSLATLAISIPLMFCYNSTLALLAVSFIPMYAGLYILSGSINKRYNRALAESGARFETDLLHSIEGSVTSRHYGAEELSSKKVEKSYCTMAERLFRASKAEVFFGVSSEAISRALSATILVCGVFAVLKGKITLGELVSFYTLSTIFCSPLSNIANMSPLITQAIVSAERLFEIMDLEDEGANTNGKMAGTMPDFRRAVKTISVRDLSYSYPGGNPLFKNFNALFEQGKITLVCGEIGCGKSTLMALLMQDYKIGKGKIFCEEIDITTISPKEWRRDISIVPQKCHMYNASILDNITCGSSNADLEKVMEICISVGLAEALAKFPSGLLTNIGEEGITLSGGEMQKIAIARMLYKDPQIMIFDESTSSMDEESERVIIKLFQHLKECGKTIIIISHNRMFKDFAERVVVIP